MVGFLLSQTQPQKFIMLSNEIFALACRAYYDEEGLIVDATNGEFAHSPLTRKECNTGYYLLHGHHQHQGLLQSKDLNKRCFFTGHANKWLLECDYFPEGYFELWDIYEKYVGDHMNKLHEKVHKEKDEFGRSVNAMKPHKEKDDLGRSVHAVKSGIASRKEKDEFGRSVNAMKCHEEKDEFGKSINAVKAGKASVAKRTPEQMREQGVKNAKKLHKEKDKLGRSINSLKAAAATNAEKDEFGRSVNGVKSAKRLHEEKDENGKSLHAKKCAASITLQIWESTMDGFRSNSAGVARHNKGNGWPGEARVRVS